MASGSLSIEAIQELQAVLMARIEELMTLNIKQQQFMQMTAMQANAPAMAAQQAAASQSQPPQSAGQEPRQQPGQ